MTKIVDIEDIRKKREKKEIGIPIENINKKELKRRGHEIGDILGCDEKGEEICVRKGKGNLYVDGDMEKERNKEICGKWTCSGRFCKILDKQQSEDCKSFRK